MEAFAPRMRRRIVELYQSGLETQDIAAMLGSSAILDSSAMLGSSLSGTRRRVWQQFRDEDRIEAKPNAGGRRPMLSEESKPVLLELVAEHPDAFLPELAEQVERRLGLRVHPQTVGRWLRELGVTRKKSRCTPASSSGPTCGRSVTAGWLDTLTQQCGGDFARVVFLDESGALTNLVRAYGRSPCGTRVGSALRRRDTGR